MSVTVIVCFSLSWYFHDWEGGWLAGLGNWREMLNSTQKSKLKLKLKLELELSLKIKKKIKYFFLTLPPTAYRILVVPRGGPQRPPPPNTNKGVISDPILL